MTLTRIDCHAVGGVAGDMFAASLFDAYPHLYNDFLSDLAQLGVQGLDTALSQRTSNGLYAQHFQVSQNTAVKPPRTLPAVTSFLHNTALSPSVVNTAVGIYQLLAEAEAAVHGKTVDTVHFHEVSDWDSMIDILAAAGIIDRLQCPLWRIGPLPLGGGTINTAHGDIPLPAPATLHLLKSFDWIDDGQPGERVTPTGAAILAYLQPQRIHTLTTASRFECVGVGCGTRELADRANIFRVCAFGTTADQPGAKEIVVQLAFEIDDMTGEELAQAMQILRQQPGVMDVNTVAVIGKKGRPASGVRLLVTPDQAESVAAQCFQQTTTLGVRHSQVERQVLSREQTVIDNHRVKAAYRPDGTVTAKIESDELDQVTTLHRRRTLARTVQAHVESTMDGKSRND